MNKTKLMRLRSNFTYIKTLKSLIYCALLLLTFTNGYSQTVESLTTKAGVSFRGMDTYGDQVVWVSGSKGTVGRSVDQGKTWEWVNPAGYNTFDFRDIEVFSAKEAVILSAGSPAIVLRTTNGGKSWKEVFRNEDPQIFLDGFDFQGKVGFAFGDPIDGNFQLYQSKNKGKTWKDVTNVMYLIAEGEEAGFAASGTSIQVLGDNVWIGTGGTYASLFQRNEKNLQMFKYDAPLMSGSSSRGIFSLSFWDDNHGIVVGGDYMEDANASNNVLLTSDAGQNWVKPTTTVGGFRSCVVHLTKDSLVCTGTSGTDISSDGGMNWRTVDTGSFNVIAKPKTTGFVYLAGSGGNIAKLVM